jgi:hypothetical protein
MQLRFVTLDVLAIAPDRDPMKKRWLGLLALVTMFVLVVVGPVLASSDGQYEIPWWTVDGGGNTLNAGGGYSLSGTAGQPDAGVLEDNGYTLAGGLWGGAGLPASGDLYIYLPLVLRS